MPCLLLNSRDATIDESTNHTMRWKVTNPRFNSMNGYTVNLLTVQIPNTVYPVNEYYAVVKFTDADGTFTTSATVGDSSNIVPGVYSGSEFATEVARAMTATATTKTYTGSYNTTTKKITISVSAGTFLWVTVSNNLYDELGVTTFAATASSQVGNVPVALQGSNFVDVVCNEIPVQSHSTSTSANVIARVPLDQNVGNVIFYNASATVDQPAMIDSLDIIRVTLYDDRGNPWKLPATSHISLTFDVQPILNAQATSGTWNAPDMSVQQGDILENCFFSH